MADSYQYNLQLNDDKENGPDSHLNFVANVYSFFESYFLIFQLLTMSTSLSGLIRNVHESDGLSLDTV